MPPVRATTIPAHVHQARVLDVNISNWTLSVHTQFSKKPLTDISFSVPYMHPHNGEGIYFMPEVGSVCWLCEPSDGNKAFVMSWTAPPVDGPGQFRGHRQDLNPGDIYLGTRDENFLVLRRGGVVQIGGTGLCQRIFLPINNTIRDFCENYGLHTLGGDLEWTIARKEADEDGHRKAMLKLSAREFADDLHPIATLEIGSHEGDKKTILTLKINDSDTADTQVLLKMGKDGNVTWEIKKDVKYKVEGKLTADIDGEVKVTTKDKVTLTAKDKLTVKAKGMEFDADGDKVTIKSDTIIKKTLEVGGAADPVVLASAGFLTYLNTHMHPTTAPGAPTGPPVAPPSAFKSKSIKSD